MKCFQLNVLNLVILTLVLAGCASEVYQEAGSYNPNTLISNSLIACHDNDIAEGKKTLEKVMTNEKSNPQYWNALGLCYSLSQEPVKANFYYDLGLEAIGQYKGIDKKQLEATLLNNMALIHLSYKRFNDAYLTFKRAEALAPEIFNIQLNISQLLLEFKYDDKALVILNKLETLRPGDTDVLYSQALIYTRKNEYEKALVTLSKINSAKNTRPDIAGVYAFNLLKINQLTDALAVIDKTHNTKGYEEHISRNKVIEKEIEAKLKEQTLTQKK